MTKTLSLAYLEEAFHKYNSLIFDNKLPLPTLKLSRAKTRLGQMACKRRISWGRTRYYDFTISISTYYNLSQEQIDDVLIHEMIHYSIAYTGLKDSSAHGVVFRGMMDNINRRFNRNITVSVRSQNILPREIKTEKTYLVLAIEMEKEKYFLSSVNPTAAGKIALQLPNIKEIKFFAWYKTKNEFFQSMPQVRTLRGREVSEATYRTMIKKMTQLSLLR